MHSTLSKALVAALAFGSANALPTSERRADAPVDNTELLKDLVTTPFIVNRYRKLLTENGNGEKLVSGQDLIDATTYDFNKGPTPVVGSQGGITNTANIDNFPILYGTGFVPTVLTVGACGVLAPHVHPRSNEFFLVTDGEVDFGYVVERDLLKGGLPTPQVNGKLTKNMATMFPQGSIHFQMNDSPDCKPASAVVMLNTDDPGVTPILLQYPAQTGSGDDAVVQREVQGDSDDFELLRPVLPPQLVAAVDKCLARCKKA